MLEMKMVNSYKGMSRMKHVVVAVDALRSNAGLCSDESLHAMKRFGGAFADQESSHQSL